MRRRRLAAAAAVAAFALGVAVLLAPTSVGLHDLVVPVVGAAALALAYRTVRARRHTPHERAETPDPELAQPVLAPGDDLPATLSTFSGRNHDQRIASIRSGLRAAASTVLRHVGPDDRERARERLDAGSWTDDPVASSFLAPGPSGWTVRGRLREAIGGESDYRRRIRRSIDAVVALADLPARESNPDDHAALDADVGELTATVTDEADEERDRETAHWRGIGALALAAVGVGVLVEQPPVVLAAVVGIGYAAYARSATPPTVALAAERDLDGEHEVDAAPGEEVAVTLAVTNESEHTLADLRLVDGVPPALAVIDGSPRLATALRPDETTTVTYAVEARRGVHEFGAVQAIARDVTGGHERDRRVPAPATLTCVPALRPTAVRVPLRERATRLAGQVATGSGGEGTEFHATREYRPGDPPSRIDWNRRARTGELSTVEFREERAATVLILVDAREVAHVAPTADAASAVDRNVDAAGRAFASLLDGGNRVGLAAIGPGDPWLAPGTGRDHRADARELLATHPAFAPVPAEGDHNAAGWRQRLRGRLPADAQLLLFSPLADGYVASIARWFDARRQPVTVVSVDATGARTPERRLARVGRELRLATLRDAGVRVVDWSWDESLDAALARAERGWVR